MAALIHFIRENEDRCRSGKLLNDPDGDGAATLVYGGFSDGPDTDRRFDVEGPIDGMVTHEVTRRERDPNAPGLGRDRWHLVSECPRLQAPPAPPPRPPASARARQATQERRPAVETPPAPVASFGSETQAP